MIELLTNHPILSTLAGIGVSGAVYWRLVYHFHRWLDKIDPPKPFPPHPVEQ